MASRLLTVPEEAAGLRLDRFLSESLSEHSRSRFAIWIRGGRVQVDGRQARSSLRLKAGQQVELNEPPPVEQRLQPQPVPFRCLYLDEDLLVVEKPAGIIVHPGAGHPDGTLVNGLLYEHGPLSPLGLPERPGIVHRLDAGTSGLLVVARTEFAHLHLARQFAEHSCERRYLALVWDHGLAESGSYKTLYGRHSRNRRKFSGEVQRGKQAVTHWERLESLPPCALLSLRLETGRTHQIRVHMSEAGHPLLGDPLYGRRRQVERPLILRRLGPEFGLKRQALHAETLGFKHPRSDEQMRFSAPLPSDLQEILEKLRALYR